MANINAIPLSINEQQAGWTHKWIIPYTTLTANAGASDTTVALDLYSATLGTHVMAAGYRLNTAFDASDSSINSLLIEVGDTDTDRLIVQKELAADGTEVLSWVTANATDTIPYSYVSATTVKALFTVAGGASPTIDELTAGQVTVYLRIGEFSNL